VLRLRRPDGHDDPWRPLVEAAAGVSAWGVRGSGKQEAAMTLVMYRPGDRIELLGRRYELVKYVALTDQWQAVLLTVVPDERRWEYLDAVIVERDAKAVD
jgi:hypothetical protein